MVDLAKVFIDAEDRSKAAFDSFKLNSEVSAASAVKFGAALAATAAIGAGFTLTAMIRDTVKARAELDDLAEVTGLSVEKLSQIQSVAKVSGAPFEEMANGVAKFNKQVAAVASGGGKDAARLFETMGVSIRDGNGKLKEADVLFEEVTGSLAKYESGIGKTAAAQELFGKSGAKLLPILSDYVNDMRTGTVVTAAQAAEAERLEKMWNRMALQAQQSRREIAGELIPTVIALTETFIASKAVVLNWDDTLERAGKGAQIRSLGEWLGGSLVSTLQLVTLALGELAHFTENFGKGLGSMAANITILFTEGLDAMRASKKAQEDEMAAREKNFERWKVGVSTLREEYEWRLKINKLIENANAGQYQDQNDRRAMQNDPLRGKKPQLNFGTADIKKEVDEFQKLLDKINGKENGLDPNFFKDLNTLWDGYKRGRITLEDYTKTVEAMIKQQDFYKTKLKGEEEAHKSLIKAYEEEVKVREQVRKIIDNYEDQVKSNIDQAKFEITTIGKTTEQITLMTEARKIDLEMRKAIAAIPFNSEDATAEQVAAYTAAVDRITQIAQKAKDSIPRLVADKQKLEEDKKAYDDFYRQVSDTATDALTAVFERGSNGLRDWIKNAWAQLKAFFARIAAEKILVSLGISAGGISGSSFAGDLIGAAAGAAGDGATGGGGGAGGFGSLSGGSSIYSTLLRAGYNYATTGSFTGVSAVNATASTNAGATGATGAFGEAAGGSGASGLGTLGSTSSTLGTAAIGAIAGYYIGGALSRNNNNRGRYGGAAGGAAGSLIGAWAAAGSSFGPWGAVIGAVLGAVVGALAADRGGPKTEGGSWIRFDGLGNIISQAGFANGKSPYGVTGQAANNEMTAELMKGVGAGFAALLKDLGGKSNGFTFGLDWDQDPKGSAGSRIWSGVIDANGKQVYTGFNDVGRDPKNFDKGIALETQRMMIAALQNSELPAYLKKVFEDIKAEAATLEEIDAALKRAFELRTAFKALEDSMKGILIAVDTLSGSPMKLLETQLQDMRDAVDAAQTNFDLAIQSDDVKAVGAAQQTLLQAVLNRYTKEKELLDGLVARLKDLANIKFDFKVGITQRLIAAGDTSRSLGGLYNDRYNDLASGLTNKDPAARLAAVNSSLQALDGWRTAELEAAQRQAEAQNEYAAMMARVAKAGIDERIRGLNEELDVLKQQAQVIESWRSVLESVASQQKQMELSGANPLASMGRYGIVQDDLQALLEDFRQADGETKQRIAAQIQNAAGSQLALLQENFDRPSNEYLQGYNQINAALTEVREAASKEQDKMFDLQAEMAARQKVIADLTAQSAALDQQTAGNTAATAGYAAQINETYRERALELERIGLDAIEEDRRNTQEMINAVTGGVDVAIYQAQRLQETTTLLRGIYDLLDKFVTAAGTVSTTSKPTGTTTGTGTGTGTGTPPGGGGGRVTVDLTAGNKSLGQFVVDTTIENATLIRQELAVS